MVTLSQLQTLSCLPAMAILYLYTTSIRRFSEIVFLYCFCTRKSKAESLNCIRGPMCKEDLQKRLETFAKVLINYFLIARYGGVLSIYSFSTNFLSSSQSALFLHISLNAPPCLLNKFRGVSNSRIFPSPRTRIRS